MENGIERRRHRRINVRLQARYMLPDQREFACLVVDVAERGVALTGTPEGKIGEKVIVYIDRLGRIEGSIARVFEGGFAVEVAGSALALRKFAQRLRLLEGNDNPTPADRRKDVRVDADDLPSRVALADGSECEILDLSLSGAEIRTDKRPPVGSVIKLGDLDGKVVRHSELDVGIEFLSPSRKTTLTDRTRRLSKRAG